MADRSLFSMGQTSSVTIVPAGGWTGKIISGRFCRRDDKLCHSGTSAVRPVAKVELAGNSVPCHKKHAQKAKGATDCAVAPGLCPPQALRPNSDYCNCGHAALEQVAFTVSGALFQSSL
jgi:hypothetical protein